MMKRKTLNGNCAEVSKNFISADPAIGSATAKR